MFVLRIILFAFALLAPGASFAQSSPETIFGLTGPTSCPEYPLTTGWGLNCVPSIQMWDLLFASKADAKLFVGTPAAGSAYLFQLVNPFTDANTSATFSAATGTGGAFTAMSNVDGPSPIGVLATGAGDTAGLLISTTTGPLNLNPTAGLQVNGVSGFSGTKTAGSCVLTITKGIITSVSGC
jgi:hypothetical protein